MKISVVTISYNQATFLERAIRSVLSQSGVEFEYIIVDPGSTDNSREKIVHFGSAISKIIFERDDGPADGLNVGFRHATGDIFAFLNSDDEFLPGAFETIVREFERRPHADFLSGCGYFIDEFGSRRGRIVPTPLSVADYAYGSSTIFQQGTFFRRHCFERVGGFNAENKTCWDGELFLDFIRAGLRQEIVYENLACFRIHGSSITGSGRLAEQYAKDNQRLFAKALGRDPGTADTLISAGFRCTKLLRNPRYVVERLLRQ
jgi:glycosyltransferase involved in cell wall biosynthesis